MEIKINLKCKCGNSDYVEIRQGKEFRNYDSFTTELAIQESITESGKFNSYQTNPDEFYITCNDCGAEVSII